MIKDTYLIMANTFVKDGMKTRYELGFKSLTKKIYI